MKFKNNNLVYFLIIIFVFAQSNFCFAASSAKDTDAGAGTNVKASDAQQSGKISDDNTNTKESSAPATAEVKKETKIKAKKQENYVTDEQLKELSEKINGMQEDLKRIEEKTIEIANIESDLSKLKDDLSSLNTGFTENKKITDKYEADFTDMQDDLKEKMDKMQEWDDILGVLKKSINNNDIEIARLKKEINSLKNEGGEDNVLVQATKSPYATLVIGGVALIGLIVACVAVASK